MRCLGPCRPLIFVAMLTLAAPSALDAAGSTPLSTRLIQNGLPQVAGVYAPDGDFERIFFLQTQGIIRVYDIIEGQLLPVPFLNINSLVSGNGGNDERGMLGLAFHPDYMTNGHFFVHYTNNSGATTIARYTVSASNPNVADPSSAQVFLTQSQPFSNHNGGAIHFGPNDGYLYIGLGDGGAGDDPQGNGQNINTLLGKMLRIDVDTAAPPLQYSIPPDNPFAVTTGRDEIWAYGLRNPWQWSFDRENGDMYIGDVGQNQIEEIDVYLATAPGGANFGWRCMEGNNCYLSGCTCNSAALTDPIHTYNHSQGFSVSGGYVYRGCAMPDMQGIYFFADFGTSQIWSLVYTGQPTPPSPALPVTNRTGELNPPGTASISNISAFGQDAYGEIYICEYFGGEVYKIVPANIETLDCDGNYIVDDCQISAGTFVDCNTNGVIDACEIDAGTETDCNGNDIIDTCELAQFDCNGNGLHDTCEILDGLVDDCDGDGVPDSCQLATDDCNGNGVVDSCDIVNGTSFDCDTDGQPDDCQLAAGTATDCNNNLILDACEIDAGFADDCDGDGQIDGCEIAAGTAEDCNANGVIDSCDIVAGTSEDTDTNGIPDECELTPFIRSDCNGDGSVDISDPVSNLDGLFGGGAAPQCLDACDANDDGNLDIADAVYVLSQLFSGGPDPAPPFPGCGPDPTDDPNDCASYNGCP